MNEELVYFIGSVVISVLGYFLKGTMADVKFVKKDLERVRTDNIKLCGDINMLRQDHVNKINGLDDKIDELKESVKELTKEIKTLNIEFAKILSDSKKKVD